MNPPYPSDAQAKAEILDAGRKIYQRGLVAANDGNLSVRVGDNALWVTPTGVSKGAMTEDMLVKLSLDGTVLEGTRKPSSETKMHLRIYQENPAVRAVVHAHPPAATAFAAAGLPLDRPVLQEAVVQLGTVPVAPFAPIVPPKHQLENYENCTKFSECFHRFFHILLRVRYHTESANKSSSLFPGESPAGKQKLL